MFRVFSLFLRRLLLLRVLRRLSWAQQPQQPQRLRRRHQAARVNGRQSIRAERQPGGRAVHRLRPQEQDRLRPERRRISRSSTTTRRRRFASSAGRPICRCASGLLLDTSNSIRQRLQFEQEAAIDFLFNVIRRDKDQAFLMTVDDQPEVIQDFTGDWTACATPSMRQRAGGGTALYDAIYQGVRASSLAACAARRAPELDVRRVLVVISDGDDKLSRHSRGEALEIAQRAGIVIYTISTSTDWIVTDQETNAVQELRSQISEGRRRSGAAAIRGRQRRPRLFPLSRRRSGAVVRAISETSCAASIRWPTLPAGRSPTEIPFHSHRGRRQGTASARAQRLLAAPHASARSAAARCGQVAQSSCGLNSIAVRNTRGGSGRPDPCASFPL